MQRPSCASTSCAPHGLGDVKGIQAHARAASVSDESQEPAKWRVLADAAFHAQRIRSPTETSAVAEQGWGFTDAASSGAVKGNAVALYDHNPWCATSKDFNLYCGMCSQRAQNVVEVGPHLCCWQCVALEHDQDFLMVCGGNYDMRAVAPARALDR